MSLKLVGNITEQIKTGHNPAVLLYRHITKEIPRILHLYDITIDPLEARLNIQALFRENASVRDPRMIEVLINKGNMEFEETAMQWKQKSHVEILLNKGYNARIKELEKNKPKSHQEIYREKLERFFAGVDTEEEAEKINEHEKYY